MPIRERMTDSRDDQTSDVMPPPLPAVTPPLAVTPPPVPNAPLQFDTAEFAEAASMACSSCQRPITTAYFELNGATLCGGCRVIAAGETGTPLLRVLRAAMAGAGAAFAGGLLYFLVAYFLEMEIGLISIAVGFAVGVAVRWGSYGRGGAAYQAMAVALTYLAIVSSLMAVGLIQLVNSGEATATTATVTPAGNGAARHDAATAERISLAEASTVNPNNDESTDEPGALVSLVMLAGLMLALPFLGGFENILGIAIMAFGLWEAWKINKRPAITGPHTVAGSNAQAIS
jgi:hypothetical protein